MTRWVEGTVAYLRCMAHGHATPHFTFVGDTDMVTDGLISLSSLTDDEIVIAEMTGDEYQGQSGDAAQRRINKLLARDDLRFVRFRRAEQKSPVAAGMSFHQFAQTWTPPRLIFACPHCDSDAVQEQNQTPAQYQQHGGVVTTLADLEVRHGR